MESRETCIFYKSIFEAINMLQTDAEKAAIYDAIFNYSFNFIEPKLSGTCLMIWKLIEPVLKKGNANYINGSKPKKKEKQKRNRSEIEANHKPNVSEVEAYKDKNKEKEKYKNKDTDKENDIMVVYPPQAVESPQKGKHLFKNSPYFELHAFAEAFQKTKCFARHPNLDIELIHDMMVNSEAKGYKYTNWIMAAAQWVERKPEQFIFSIESKLKSDPAYALMNKGDKIAYEAKLKRDMQRTLIHDPNDPYSY